MRELYFGQKMLVSYQELLFSWIIPLFIGEAYVAPNHASLDDAGSGEGSLALGERTYEIPVSDNPYKFEVFLRFHK